MLADLPWLFLGAAGLALGLLRAPAGQRALTACLGLAALAYGALLIAYVDLLPTGLWRYGNVHYFKWMFPLFGLFVLLFVRWAPRGARDGGGGDGGAAAAHLPALRRGAGDACPSPPGRWSSPRRGARAGGMSTTRAR
ncbi:MAG: hypothetical protein WDN24_02045 [Sphingomonas sp.]